MSWDSSEEDGGDLAKIDAPAVNTAWDDEDQSDDAAEAWDEEKKSDAPKAPVQHGERRKKTQAQLRAEKSAKLAKERAEAAAAAAEDPNEAKRRAQRREERSDMAATADLFGVDVRDIEADELFADSDDEGAEGNATAVAAAAAVEQVITTDKLLSQKPKTEFEFNKYANMVSEHVTRHKGSYLYMHLVKQLVSKVTKDFKSDELKELHAHVGVLMNDRLRTEREADGKKKKNKNKAKVNKKKLHSDLRSDRYDDMADEYGYFL